MNKRTTIILLLCIVLVFFQGFKDKETGGKTIRFKQLTSTIKSDTSGVIEAIIWNGERYQTIFIDCTVSDSLFMFTGKVYPNDRNVTLFYSGHIKLK